MFCALPAVAFPAATFTSGFFDGPGDNVCKQTLMIMMFRNCWKCRVDQRIESTVYIQEREIQASELPDVVLALLVVFVCNAVAALYVSYHE
jgi:hypothetical protein